ncbi:MAG: phage integrase SAM-like domain-containing protein [Selenomonadaceae bacterium]|nr:phage integrase SAM-like domain-containing protein [Selenomonadaceae bacterium]
MGHITLDKLTTVHINQFIKDNIESGKSHSTVRKHKTILSGILKNAVAEGLINVNPVMYSNTYLSQNRNQKLLLMKIWLKF